jgi:hypothetical protein
LGKKSKKKKEKKWEIKHVGKVKAKIILKKNIWENIIAKQKSYGETL